MFAHLTGCENSGGRFAPLKATQGPGLPSLQLQGGLRAPVRTRLVSLLSGARLRSRLFRSLGAPAFSPCQLCPCLLLRWAPACGYRLHCVGRNPTARHRSRCRRAPQPPFYLPSPPGPLCLWLLPPAAYGTALPAAAPASAILSLTPLTDRRGSARLPLTRGTAAFVPAAVAVALAPLPGICWPRGHHRSEHCSVLLIFLFALVSLTHLTLAVSIPYKHINILLSFLYIIFL